jgi:manganese/zinc/iron transport system ATP- binding protein
MSAILEVNDLHLSYGEKQALTHINLSVPAGCITGIIGPNGSGKSSLLKSIMGLVKIQKGSIKIAGESIDKVRHLISYVPQRESVDWNFPASVKDVVLMGTYNPKQFFSHTTKSDRIKANEAIEIVGLTALANRQIGQLSGGEQQRVFLARALARNAEIYFLDEPFSGVDAASEKKMMEILKSMNAEGKSIFLVHHDLHNVQEYFQHLIMLNNYLVACSTCHYCFNKENLSKTYGGVLHFIENLNDSTTDV